MLVCRDNSVLPFDVRVLERAQNALEMTFDPDYLAMLPRIHGGEPVSSFFTTPAGHVRQIGWFVSFLDSESHLPPPFQSAFYFQGNDTRIDDRSIPAILDDEVDPFQNGERIVPFAALYTNGQFPHSLRLYSLDSYPNDALCFDRESEPHSIVNCHGEPATVEAVRWDEEEIDDVDYDQFLEPVADSFKGFVRKLRQGP